MTFTSQHSKVVSVLSSDACYMCTHICTEMTYYLSTWFLQSYSGLRGAVAFSLALIRISDEPELDDPATEELTSERQLRRSMLTAVTVLVLFTVFVQVHAYRTEHTCMCAVCQFYGACMHSVWL